jgi:long-chain acyl-CoA synthetase
MTASAYAPVRDPRTAAAGSGGGMPDTFPKLLLEHARVRPGRSANREKDYGI